VTFAAERVTLLTAQAEAGNRMNRAQRNIVLIGMPGAGKSTVGVLLAKQLSRNFLDTDIYIQAMEGRPLQAIIDRQGGDRFLGIEERHILQLRCRGFVLATGGSVVYSRRAMRRLRAGGIVVYLHVPVPVLTRRLLDLESRGVVMGEFRTIGDLAARRDPLYRRYADVVIRCGARNHQQVINMVRRAVAPYLRQETRRDAVSKPAARKGRKPRPARSRRPPRRSPAR
jgi:shikimate kinase